MTLDEARTLRLGDIISNDNLPDYGHMTVEGPVAFEFGTDTIPAVSQGRHVDSFVSLSVLVRRGYPTYLAIPQGA